MTKNSFATADAHLKQADPVMAQLVRQHGPFELEPRSDYYFALVSSIIGQQLSVKAAASIKKRFVDLFDGVFPKPEQILELDNETLRGIGFSYAKANYVKDLAQHILDGRLLIEKLPELSNEEIIKELVAVKGIGEWTAHMFLIFALNRLDILPVGDLGVRNGIRQLYGFADLPTPDEIVKLATNNNWHPYESVAAWYLWRSLDNAPK
jgi:DNA-3-methyladenine glycosylase II